MDAKDAIIFQQLDVIRAMTENNLKRVGADFFGESDVPDEQTPKVSQPDGKTPAAPPPIQAEEAAVERIEDLKAELETYVGLSRVKQEVNDLIDLATVYARRKEFGLPTTDMSLHMVFSGNPGTGKTMIARFMARVYKALHILSKGQLVEVDRSGLVAGYVGQTAIKTKEAIDKALGGVLFIDEAYALTLRRGDNDFGQEAVDTLLKAMEDERDDLVVIVAGYDGLMQAFVQSNPGLASRFNRYLHFEDYTLDELTQIFEMQCKKGAYTLSDDAKAAAKSYIEACNRSDASFGNARGVRNLFEKVLVKQAGRLADEPQVTRDMLMEITVSDIDAARGLEGQMNGEPDDTNEPKGSNDHE